MWDQTGGMSGLIHLKARREQRQWALLGCCAVCVSMYAEFNFYFCYGERASPFLHFLAKKLRKRLDGWRSLAKTQSNEFTVLITMCTTKFAGDQWIKPHLVGIHSDETIITIRSNSFQCIIFLFKKQVQFGGLVLCPLFMPVSAYVNIPIHTPNITNNLVGAERSKRVEILDLLCPWQGR